MFIGFQGEKAEWKVHRIQDYTSYIFFSESTLYSQLQCNIPFTHTSLDCLINGNSSMSTTRNGRNFKKLETFFQARPPDQSFKDID